VSITPNVGERGVVSGAWTDIYSSSSFFLIPPQKHGIFFVKVDIQGQEVR